MSTDPKSGLAYITMFQSTNGTLSNGEQFSGVLISPDEILTVAHGVTNPDGTVRNYGTAYLGYDGGTLSNGDAVTSVHVVDGSHPSGAAEYDPQIATDYAVIHLATPVTDAQVFALGTGSAGTYTVAGYPAVDGGRLVSATETLTAVDGILSGTSLVTDGTAAGASGGAVYSLVNGTPTVSGLVVAEDGKGTGFMSSLSQAQVDQINAWVSADDAGKSWTQGGSGTTPVATQPSTPVVVTPVDRLDQLGSLLDDAASSTSGGRAQVMRDVATSLTMARQEGLSGSDLPDSAYEAANLLQGISYVPNRATAYMAGIMASESGVSRNRVLGYIANVFGIDLGGSKQMNQLAMAGYAEDKTFASSTTGAATTVSASIQSLADTLSQGAGGTAASLHAYGATDAATSLVASHLTHQGA